MTEKCLECDRPAKHIRSTQFAGNHPYCEEHAKQQADFKQNDSYTYWTTPSEIEKFLENVKAGADQQEDDTQEYREIPMTTITGPDGKPYISVIADGPLIKLRLHRYDNTFERGIYFTFDRKALPDLILALRDYAVPV